METPEDSNKRPLMFLIGTIIIAILLIVVAANLLRKPATTASPYDTTPANNAPAPTP